MTGNDIVDLETALKESDWRRKGYLEKIFSPAERFLISSAEDAETMVWLLWTMKESAYKIFSRAEKTRIFAPAAIVCSNLIVHKKTAAGDVLHQDQRYFTSSSITEKYIHTFAVSDREVLNKVKVRISSYHPDDRSYKTGNPASVSHHGRYLALVYL